MDYNSQIFKLFDTAITYTLCFAFVTGLFLIVKKVYYGKDKCENLFLNSVIPVVIVIVTIIVKFLLMSFLRTLNLYSSVEKIFAIGMVVVIIYIYVFILSLLVRLLFKGFAVNYPVNNNFFVRLLKVLHIACLIADLTIVGALFGVPIFLVLWVLQYIFANEKNPFFAFRVYSPKSYKEEEIIDVEELKEN